MKTQITILVIIGMMLTSCTPEAAAGEIEVATEVHVTEVPTQESSITEAPTEVSNEQEPTLPETSIATESPFACVSQLTPENGAHLPVTGKVTFSWTAMSAAESYTLNITLPSGQIASFDTNQTVRDRYMEAFVTGGEYHWQVTAQGADGSDICVSEIFTFDKPAHEQPNGGGNEGTSHDGENNDGEKCPDGSEPDPIFGCGGNG